MAALLRRGITSTPTPQLQRIKQIFHINCCTNMARNSPQLQRIKQIFHNQTFHKYGWSWGGLLHLALLANVYASAYT